MIEQAAALGILPDDVLRMTPRFLHDYARGRGQAERRERITALWAAWHGAAFGRAKRLPNLKRMIAKLDPAARRRRSPDELLALAERIHIQLGGTPRRATSGD